MQTLIATSTGEAEYGAAFAAAKKAVWVRRILKDIGIPVDGPTVINCDNQCAIKISGNEFLAHKCTKHWDIQYKYVNEKVTQKVIKLEYVSTDQQRADILTKAQTPSVFQENVKMLNMM